MKRIEKSDFVKITRLLNGRVVRGVTTARFRGASFGFSSGNILREDGGTNVGLIAAEENITWIHGWPPRDGTAIKALIAANTLAKYEPASLTAIIGLRCNNSSTWKLVVRDNSGRESRHDTGISSHEQASQFTVTSHNGLIEVRFAGALCVTATI